MSVIRVLRKGGYQLRYIAVILTVLVFILLPAGCGTIVSHTDESTASSATTDVTIQPAESPANEAVLTTPTLPASSSPTVSANGEVVSIDSTTGKFIGLEYGDYVHLGVLTADGEEVWFWVGSQCPTDPENLLPGQSIEITWKNRNVYIDEAGEEMNMALVTGITVLSE